MAEQQKPWHPWLLEQASEGATVAVVHGVEGSDDVALAADASGLSVYYRGSHAYFECGPELDTLVRMALLAQSLGAEWERRYPRAGGES